MFEVRKEVPFSKTQPECSSFSGEGGAESGIGCDSVLWMKAFQSMPPGLHLTTTLGLIFRQGTTKLANSILGVVSPLDDSLFLSPLNRAHPTKRQGLTHHAVPGGKTSI